jgi:hypothetical protein
LKRPLLATLAEFGVGTWLAVQTAFAFMVAWAPEYCWYPGAQLLVVPAVVVERLRGRRRGDPRRRMAWLAEFWVERMPALRSYRPGGWRPPTAIVGRELLDGALADGGGAIVWVAPFRYHSLTAKRALGMAGYEVTHLSQSSHGFGRHPWAVRWLNRLRTNPEDRYLRERASWGGDNAAARTSGAAVAMLHLRRVLKGGGIVSITMSRFGSRTVPLVFHDRSMPVAMGAIELASATHAPLLPVFPVRRANGRIVLYVEKALPVPERGSGMGPAETLGELGRLFERYTSEYPGQIHVSRRTGGVTI